MKGFITTAVLLVSAMIVHAQPCTTPGQTPSTAFPVCGSTTFNQTTVPICGTQSLGVPGCSGAAYSDKNPFWYKFTCFQSGTLGFLIQPVNPGDDYDWQLYDITNRDPNEVYTNISLVVTGNWAGTFGNTGASASGVNFIQCASDPAANLNSFSTMPNLIQGHTYLLLVSHYTNSQSGYSLSFGGGTAVITDPKQPALVAAEASCGGDVIRVKLNKKMKCTSLAANGSDFSLSPGSAGIISASGIGCNGGFDTDSVQLQLNGFLAPGTYTLNIKNGSDGNTMLDFCDNAIPVNAQVSFTVYPLVPTPMDSLAPVSCSPQTLRLVFKKPMLCSSVAANGSDFLLNGPYSATISGASASCTGTATTSKEIIITLAQPLYQAGTFTLQLRTGTDGNTILDECGKETPAGSFVTFTIKDTVHAGFTFDKRYGCTTDTVQFYHQGGNGITAWNWNLDEGQTSILQNPQGLYQQFTNKNVSLVVSNGFCSDTATATVVLDNFLQAAFTAFEDHCPNEAASFTGTATGQVVQHHWSFGDGSTSSDVSPVHTFGQPNITTPYTVTYTVTDSLGCQSSASKIIRVYSSCYIAVPNAFTPNGDGKNDFLRVLNAVKAEQLEFRVYNRWGQMVFMTNDWKRGWNGTIRDIDQPTGTYVWHLVYTDRQTRERRSMRGTATLIR